MAAIVEQPVSALPEVIDVDEYYRLADENAPGPSSSSSSPAATTSRPRPVPRPWTRTVETINLVDSDSDDEDEVMIVGPSAGHQSSRASTFQRMRSPPPPSNISATVVPPVPPVPRRYQAFAAFPPQASGSAPVIAAPDVDGFVAAVGPREREREFAGLPRRANVGNMAGPSSSAAPTAAPPSHHTPAMGLGGALISSNTARAQQQAATTANRARRALPLPLRRQPVLQWGSDEEDYGLNPMLHGRHSPGPDIHTVLNDGSTPMQHYLRMMGHAAADILGFGTGGAHARHGAQPKQPDPMYMTHYTHPRPANPGFTHDFSVTNEDEDGRPKKFFPPTSADAPIILDDDDEFEVPAKVKPAIPSGAPMGTSGAGSSKSAILAPAPSLSAVLVCARCLDPLVLNQHESGKASVSEGKAARNGRRVWALRCGHMLDEKCLDIIGRPKKIEYLDLVDSAVKEKTEAEVTPQEPAQPVKTDETVVEPQDAAQSTPQANIRSRLRSRNTGSGSGARAGPSASTSSPSSSPSSSSDPMDLLGPPSKRRRVAGAKGRGSGGTANNGKGKGKKPAQPKVKREERIETYEWRCPVEGCRRVHASVRKYWVTISTTGGNVVGGDGAGVAMGEVVEDQGVWAPETGAPVANTGAWGDGLGGGGVTVQSHTRVRGMRIHGGVAHLMLGLVQPNAAGGASGSGAGKDPRGAIPLFA